MGYSIDYQSGKTRQRKRKDWKFIPILFFLFSFYLRLIQPEILDYLQNILLSDMAQIAIAEIFLENSVLFEAVHTFCDELFIP